MAAEPPRREHKPLVERVDALLRRHQEAQRLAEAEVPLLTEIVESAPVEPPALSGAALEALTHSLERSVLERLAPELDRALEAHVRRALDEALRDALAGAARTLHEELSASLGLLSREAVADAVSRALGPARSVAAPAGPAAGDADQPPESAQR